MKIDEFVNLLQLELSTEIRAQLGGATNEYPTNTALQQFLEQKGGGSGSGW